jgi:folate-binding protein YgfZ
MASDMIAPLHNRGIISVTGADAAKLLQGLITNDMDALSHDGAAIHTGLLSPQGKILFDFFLVQTPTGFLIDVTKDKAADLVKRLTMYKLRADVVLRDVSANYAVYAQWGPALALPSEMPSSISVTDPRAPAMGQRILMDVASAAKTEAATTGAAGSEDAYHAHRIALGIPEGGKDYDFGDAYPHEAGFDWFGGVSFTKGCYVGQEVVARMHNKTVVRKRVVKIAAAEPISSGADILLGEAPIGRIGSVDGDTGLAMVRLDRAAEARDKAITLTAGGIPITVDQAALEAYTISVSARPTTPGIA